MVSINYLMVLIAAVVNMFLGWLWYGPLFGKPWMKLMGFTPEKIQQMKAGGEKIGRSMNVSYSIMFVGSLLMAWVLAHAIIFASAYLFVNTSLYGAAAGIIVGFLNWLGFVAPVTLTPVLWENKPWKLWFLNAGYYLVGLCLMGAILAAWK
jgi:hypothetical protein